MRQIPVRHRALLRPRALLTTGAAAALMTALLSPMPALADGDVEDLGTATSHGAKAPVLTPPSLQDGQHVAEDKYLVQVAGAPQTQGTSKRTLMSKQDGVKDKAKDAGIDLKVGTSYTQAWNGMSVTLSQKDLQKLRDVDGIEAIYPVVDVALPPEEDDPSSPEDEYANGMTGVDTVQKVDGLTGKGVTVGIIDSGIDYNNPDLGGSGTNDQTKDFPGSRVTEGHDFVGDDYDANKTGAAHAAKPDAYPDDCGGHGSHVAGIVGAKGEVTGVAPDVDFASYRVFGCEGSSSTDIILAAMDRAVADDVDVINMSLGAAMMSWGSYPTAQAANEITDRGIVMVNSGGNEGESGTFSGGAPGVGAKVITVGSVENTDARSPYFTAGKQKVGYAAASDGGTVPTTGKVEVVSAGEDSTEADAPVLACEPSEIPKPTAKKQALLIKRGTCSFHDKAANAQKAGYTAVVLYNNSAGIISPTVAGDPAVTIPVVSITQEDGIALQKAIAEKTTTIGWKSGQIIVPNAGAGLMSAFSSYGLTAELGLKPDVSAPGGQIWSTVPLEQGGHGSKSGTSMASPHVAGAAALLLQEHADWDPVAVKSALVNTADPLDWSLEPGKGYLEPVHRQGAGMLDMVEAAHTSTAIKEPTISLGDSSKGGHTVTVSVRNNSDEAKTYAVSEHTGVATGGSPSNPEFEVADPSVRLSARSITVAPHRAELVTVRVSEDFGEDGIIYGGWIQLTSDDEDLSVPFAGLSGDYQNLDALDAQEGLPSLGKAQGEDIVPVGGKDASYSLEGSDVPYVLYYLDYPVSRLDVAAYTVKADGSKGKLVNPKVGTVSSESHLGRSQETEALSWDGTYETATGKTRTVTDGKYILEVRALKALGDPDTPSDWQTWDSGALTIAQKAPKG
ncbi:peptidase S8 [Brachybacterium endophyticum]|uniref:Peptidase S8 n=1 Tax=Brachybacterium endophyticum TaxID=2182385 RepID=A0A2U2RN98_9MICO|nr:S8 family serine peptidase [Brachybacterium endophyticum]PWH07343.1 peptidase S8 [Brachybacterium endophyticum]